MNDAFVEIIAHRGASADAPENTMAAFRAAWEQGADGIEGDFRLTEDGVIVCVHDPTMERTSGDPRDVSRTSFREIRSLDVGCWKSSGFAGESVPTLVEVLDSIPEGRSILVEIKSGIEIVPFLLPLLDASEVPDERITVISFDDDLLHAVHRQRPRTRLFLLSSFEKRDVGWSPTVESLIKRAGACGAVGLGVRCEIEVIDGPFVRRCRAAGLELNLWTVDEPEAARRFVEYGVRSMTTNRPSIIGSECRGSEGPPSPSRPIRPG